MWHNCTPALDGSLVPHSCDVSVRQLQCSTAVPLRPALIASLDADLKSANLLLDDVGVVKIGDLGLSRVLSGQATQAMTGGLGTYQWMAPEVRMVRARQMGVACPGWARGEGRQDHWVALVAGEGTRRKVKDGGRGGDQSDVGRLCEPPRAGRGNVQQAVRYKGARRRLAHPDSPTCLHGL